MNARSWALCIPDAATPAQLHPIRDGLLLDPIRIDSLPEGTEVVAAVPHLNLDLEGRRVINDEACKLVTEPIGRRLRELLPPKPPPKTRSRPAGLSR